MIDNAAETVSTKSIAEPTIFDHFAVTPVDLILLCSLLAQTFPWNRLSSRPYLNLPRVQKLVTLLEQQKNQALLHERHQSA